MPSNVNRPASNGAATDDHLDGRSLHIVDGSSDTATGPEFATIGAVVLAASSIQDTVLGAVADDDFTDPRCHFVIGAIRRMRAEGLPVDMLTLTGYVQRHALLEGGMPRVNLASWLHETTCAAPVPASAPWYADLVVESAARRAAQYAGQRITAAAEGDSLADLRAVVTDESATVIAAIERVGGGLNV